MGIDPESVDLNIQRPMPGIDGSDYQISRQFTYLVRKIWNVRQMHDLKGKVKGAPTTNWVHDPKFVSLGSTLSKWLDELPRELQVTFPDDETPPWLPSHFVGNMHSYYHLTKVMLHRPQLMHSSSYADGSWKRHMAVCYASSKKMCRLQEGILRTFGINGLLCMQRGINFVIYAVLTCTMVHLVSIHVLYLSLTSELTRFRWLLPRQIRNLIMTPRTSLHVICVFLKPAPLHGRSRTCRSRSML